MAKAALYHIRKEKCEGFEIISNVGGRGAADLSRVDYTQQKIIFVLKGEDKEKMEAVEGNEEKLK